ncbi:helix-turn-helix domain-containing protein [Moheibacter sediminis]|uniref:Helix-turn-helix domain-containing protein n=1 Tax=Moheibacter sediminis TaxID=1434700 RepID=A0A1W2AQQ0_9FLAO|nr:helix-turn-helix domain-containing protein [Moheibacter sediminis]SMC62993.1 Helix-turn-helix domain-containing protein [Moheibacter sediminis]
MKIYTLAFVLALFGVVLSAQELTKSDEEFNLIYDKIAIEIAGKEPNVALNKADSLYLQSETNYQKFKSLMLKAHVYAQIGELQPSIEAAKKAEILVSETNFHSWQARISGFISTQYRVSGLYSEAKKYLDKTFNHSKKIKSDSESARIQSFIYQEKADISKQEKDYPQAIAYFRESGKILEKFPKDNKTNYYLLSTNYAYLGDAFFLNHVYDSALVYYNKANENLSLSQYDDPKFKSYILMGLGKLDVINKNEDSGSAKIKQALMFADEAGSLAVKEGANQALSHYYYEKKDSINSNYQTYVQRTIEAVKQISEVKQKAADYSLQIANKEKEDILNRSAIYFIIVSFFLVVGTIIFVRYRNKKKHEFSLYQKAINELRESKIVMEEYILDEEIEVSSPQELEKLLVETGIDSKKKDLLSKETEEFLMRKLEKFERGIKFTDKNMSVSMLSEILNTNSKYLNYIITKNRNKNFNQYINHLRINYIIQKIQSSPEYLHYKISSMAEECGFSSHGKFTEAFKKEIGINPSAFIEFMITEHKKNNLKMEDLNWD